MENGFGASLLDQLLKAVEEGVRDVVVWGLNRSSSELLCECQRLGMPAIGSWHLVDWRREVTPAATLNGCRLVGLQELQKLPIDALVIAEDSQKEEALRQFASRDDRIPRVIIAGAAHFDEADADFQAVSSRCLSRSYATGYPLSLRHLFDAIRYLARQQFTGAAVELGMFKAGTTTFIAQAFAHFGRSDVRILGFDIFESFPAPRTIFDLYTNPACEFSDAEAVSEYCRRYSIEVVKGDICDTVERLQDVPLILTFFDTDNYSPARAALEVCWKQTVKGGVLAFDHFTSTEQFVYTLGERMAAREFLEGKDALHLHGTGIFVKL